jgi:hypothetical protein
VGIYNPIDYLDAIPIEEVNPANCSQDLALERATNAM